MIRILIIEDNRLLREGLTVMLNKQKNIKIVGAFADSENVIKVIKDKQPEILLLDIGLGNRNSMILVKQIKKNFPHIKIIIMDLLTSESDVYDFVQSGVSAFILKDASVANFVRTVYSVAKGNKVLPSNLTTSLFSQIVVNASKSAEPKKIIGSILMTKREKQVIALIAKGLTNKEIAQKIHRSAYTVKSHVHNILEKLALRSRLQIANYAKETDLDS